MEDPHDCQVASASVSRASASQYSVKLLNQGSAVTAVILNPTGQPVATLTQGVLKKVVQTGNTSLLGPQLLSVLASTGTNPLQFATQLSKALHD